MKLCSLIDHLPFARVENGDADPEIISIEHDTRRVKEGSLFVCIEGTKFDGHDFAPEAVKKGAVAVLSNRKLELDVPNIIVNDTKRALAVLANVFYDFPSGDLFLIGVTGTNGKTSVTHLIDHIFASEKKKTGIIGTLYAKIGKETYELKNTTPDSLALQKYFYEMRQRNVETVSMEVSSHALIQGRAWGTDFDVAVFTNLTQDHLDYHKTMEEYKKAKTLLFSQLGNSYSSDRKKFAVLNADDPVSNELKQMTAAHVITYGIKNKPDVRAENILYSPGKTEFDVHTPEGKVRIQIPLIGEFNVYNTLAAISTGLAYGFSLEAMADSLRYFKGVPGRFELVQAGQDFTVIVDYAHTPDSLENVLKTIHQLKHNRIFVVVGCGGDRDKGKRPLMAKVACDYATDPVFTSDNPRSEDPLAIIKDMEEGVKGRKYQVIPDRREAIRYAVNNASVGDIVLIAGKGHEDYQIIGDKIIDFDDRLEAKEAIIEKTIK